MTNNSRELQEINDKLLKLRNAILTVGEKIEELEGRIDLLDRRIINVESAKLNKELIDIFSKKTPQELQKILSRSK